MASLEQLNITYQNLLQQYKQATLNYVNSQQQQQQQQKKPLIAIPGTSFWGTGSQGDFVNYSSEDCRKACEEKPDCTGATYETPTKRCHLRQGEGALVAANSEDWIAFVPSTRAALQEQKRLNQQLLETTREIQEKIREEGTPMEDLQQIEETNRLLELQYQHLLRDQERIQQTLHETQTMSEASAQSQQSVTRASQLLLVLLGIAFFIGLLFVRRIETQDILVILCGIFLAAVLLLGYRRLYMNRANDVSVLE